MEPLPDGAPVNAVAVLRYTYNDRFIGKAYLLAKEADVNLVLPSDSNLADSGDGQNAGGSGQSGDFPFLPIHLSSAMVTAIAVTSILAVLMASVIAWILYSRRKEAKELAARREARRRRLQAYGDEKEFQRLLEMRKSKNTSSHED